MVEMVKQDLLGMVVEVEDLPQQVKQHNQLEVVMVDPEQHLLYLEHQ
jgi:hypothetical protein